LNRINKYIRPIKICKGCGESKPHRAFGLCSHCYDSIKYETLKEKNKIKNLKERKITDDIVFRYYTVRRYTTKKIAKILNISQTGVRQRLERIGVKLRKDNIPFGNKNNLRHGYYSIISTYKKSHPTCEICGWKWGVDCHHIKQIKNGGNNSINNLICLCPNHHRLADRQILRIEKQNGQLSIIDLRKIE